MYQTNEICDKFHLNTLSVSDDCPKAHDTGVIASIMAYATEHD